MEILSEIKVYVCMYRMYCCDAGYRERTRTTLRVSRHHNLPCPHMREFQPCEYPLCHRWRATPSGPCRLKYPDMQCGEGMRNRSVECVSVAGVCLLVSLNLSLSHLCHLRRQPYARVHCGSSGPKSVSAMWPPTRRPSCKLDF